METPTSDRAQLDEIRWQAVLKRDATADGQFYYGVRTSGVFCRPSCPSRRPNRANVSFYETADAAERAGFRPCKRCRPTETSVQERAVAQVIHLLETTEPEPTLSELSEAVGLSPFHLQRLFKRAMGVSPKAYLMARRAERLRTELQRGGSVTEAMYDAGYGSARALYETAHQYLGMNPATYRNGGAGEEIRCACAETPLGTMLIAVTAKGVCALRFGEAGALLSELQAEFPKAKITEDETALAPFVVAIREYLAGVNPRLDLPVDIQATAFQQRVWDALRQIPYGETRTYGEIACTIGDPAAVRAVARACASNPVALVVPCHRVIRSGGALSGYRWGIERKEFLLTHERQQAGGG